METKSSMKDIFSELSFNLKSYFMIKRVGDITSFVEHSAPVKCTKKFDNYTVEDFLIIYKINRLLELGIISDKKAKLLNDLYNMKLRIREYIADEFYKNLDNFGTIKNNLKIDKLNEQLNEINKILIEYHLTLEDFELKNTFDNLIKSENHDNNYSIQEMKNTLVKVKKDIKK